MKNSVFQEKNRNSGQKKKPQSVLESFIKRYGDRIFKLLNNTKDFIFVAKIQENGMVGPLIEVNNVVCHKLGYTKQELLSLDSEDIGKDMDPKRMKELVRELLQKQYVFFETNSFTKNGRIIPIQVTAHVFSLGKQKIILAVGQDRTKSKLTEIKLEEKNKKLEVALEELKKVQEQLIQQEKFVAIGQLAAGVAHEVNNPLGYISSNIETAKGYFESYNEIFGLYKNFMDQISSVSSEKLETKVQEIKEMEGKMNFDFISTDLQEVFVDVEDGLERISDIVKSLKTFSRVDNSQELEEYDLNKGIKDTLMVARNEIKNHLRVIQLLGEIPTIKAFGNEIDQVLLNIILNGSHAIKMKKSEKMGHIIVHTYALEEYIICEIEDNGIGIEKKYLSQIFDPFFTTKKVGEGTGMGLSIAYDIIKNKHKGELLVKSTLGAGTIFTIKLPIND